VRLATSDLPETLVIPTGFGKTAAVIASWLWKRSCDSAGVPNRLIYCLPMRTLVEQTADIARTWVDAAAVHFGWSQYEQPLVEVLMGGEQRPRGAPEWIMQMDRPAILIGTQDMLISAALMRGYGARRFRWPVDFALLHTDALWVFDEVQLAGATLPTSAQLQAWRQDGTLYPPSQSERSQPARTLWMSATLDPAWLKTVDHEPRDAYRANDLKADDLAAPHAEELWRAVKRLSMAPAPPALKSPKEEEAHGDRIAGLVRGRIRSGATVLVFLNTVVRAQAVYRALLKAGVKEPVLLHSRFRPQERRAVTERALARPGVIVTTQALEAGVDITSAVLITELAPWSSLVQRIGRCNRYGECGPSGADVLWIDLPAGAEAPYDPADLEAARAKLSGLTDCGPHALSRIAPSPPPSSPVIRRRDLLDLFDTEADLSGFEVDVSMYVRETDDVDLALFWRDVPGKSPDGPAAAAPSRDELCPAPIGRTRHLLKRKGVRAWRLDGLGHGKAAWTPLLAGDLRPGLNVMIAADGGGYDPRLGFLPESSGAVSPLPRPEADSSEPAAGLDDDLDTVVGAPVTLDRHSRHVRDEAERLCDQLGIGQPVRALLVETALWHDRGKAHPAFQQMLDAQWREGAELLAKSDRRPKPADQGVALNDGATKPNADHRRPRFRHELASSLAYLEAKDWRRDADLGAYLIAAHHGKVRMRLRALPEETVPEDGRLFARGVWDGDELPATVIAETTAPGVRLDLDLMLLGEGRHGPSWSARMQGLLQTYGPFRLAWLETLVRVADWRASRAEEYVAKSGQDPDTAWGIEMRATAG
jgi:CRISPR-associated endonuclease/helicase Cas3